MPTTTTTAELCVNGMSFSRRNSSFANSAVVVSVGPSDWEKYAADAGPLAGIALQREVEVSSLARLDRAGARDGWDGMGWDGMGWDGLGLTSLHFTTPPFCCFCIEKSQRHGRR